MAHRARRTRGSSPVTSSAALERLCIGSAVTAGRFIRDERPDRLGVADTKSTDTDVVTVMDRRSEELLHRLILESRPDDGILGEEGADVTGTSGLTWVIDPIDGTVNYLYDIPAYAVSVAVVVGDASGEGTWTPVAGAVADPSLRLVHHARRGAEPGPAPSRRRDRSAAWCSPRRRRGGPARARPARDGIRLRGGGAERPGRHPDARASRRARHPPHRQRRLDLVRVQTDRSMPTRSRDSTPGTSRRAGSSSRRRGWSWGGTVRPARR